MAGLNLFFVIVAVGFTLSLPVNAADPPVKKNKNNICHPKRSPYYKKIKNYTPYKTMKECINSGGRKPTQAAEPPFKKSEDNICFPKGSSWYTKTKNYTPYKTMKECIKSGGKEPR